MEHPRSPLVVVNVEEEAPTDAHAMALGDRQAEIVGNRGDRKRSGGVLDGSMKWPASREDGEGREREVSETKLGKGKNRKKGKQRRMETGQETLTVAHSIHRSVDAYRPEIGPSTATATATEVVGGERTGLPGDGDAVSRQEEMETERSSARGERSVVNGSVVHRSRSLQAADGSTGESETEMETVEREASARETRIGARKEDASEQILCSSI
ncbi:hypothetical protein ACLOJK_039072 [Asimina triloba]